MQRSNHAARRTRRDLAPLPDADQAGFAGGWRHALGPAKRHGDPTVGDGQSFGRLSLSDPRRLRRRPTCRSASRSGSRAATSRPQPAAARSSSRRSSPTASRGSRRSASGTTATRTQIRDQRRRRLTGGCGSPGGRVLRLRCPGRCATCSYGAGVYVDWGDPRRIREVTQLHRAGERRRRVVPPTGPAATPTGIVDRPARSRYGDGPEQWQQPETGDNPVSGEAVHLEAADGGAQSAYRARQRHRAVHRRTSGTHDTAGAVALVRTSVSGGIGRRPPWRPSTTSPTAATVVTVFPTIGIRSVLQDRRLTRRSELDDPQAKPDRCVRSRVAGPGVHGSSANGCQPWYGENHFTDATWWNTTTKECPDGHWFSDGTMPAPYGLNSCSNPWRCVLHGAGQLDGQTGDWMPSRPRTATTIENNTCQTGIAARLLRELRRQAGHRLRTAGSQKGGDLDDPRVINLFIVPYQALKGVTGSKARDPGPRLRVLLRHGLDGANNSRATENDPCPDPDFNGVGDHRARPTKGTDHRRLRRDGRLRARPGRPDRDLRRRTS